MYLITYTNLLDPKYVERLQSFNNKILASLFNTFDEYILLDADTVPFINPEEFFEIDEYKENGHYMFTDRQLNIRGDKNRLDFLKNLEPSLEEVDLINTEMIFTSQTLNNKTKTAERGKLFFSDRVRHIGESGVLVTDKNKKIFGTLMSLMTILNPILSKAGHGDKEFFWLGPLYAGLSYAFEPSDAALMGFPIKEYDDSGKYTRTKLCDTHIAHAHNGRLLWTNGGLAKAKDDKLTKEQNPRMELNGFLCSDRNHGLWQPTANILGGYHCAYAVEVGSSEAPHGYVGWLDLETFQEIDNISKVWNDAEL